jgi:hypothetical protein
VEEDGSTKRNRDLFPSGTKHVWLFVGSRASAVSACLVLHPLFQIYLIIKSHLSIQILSLSNTTIFLYALYLSPLLNSLTQQPNDPLSSTEGVVAQERVNLKTHPPEPP